MKKILFCLLCLFSVMAQAYTGIQLTFNRTGSMASTVTTTVCDEMGQAIEGVSVKVACNMALRATAGSITNAILCPSANGNTSPTITMGFKITGLDPSFAFEQAGLDIHAFNGSSKYQESNDGVSRQWNVLMKENGEEFGTLTDIDIAAGITSHHKVWKINHNPAFTVGDDGTLEIVFTITAGTTNKGCFFGLSSLTLGMKDTPVVTPDPCPSLSVVTLPCTALGNSTYLSQIDITGAGAVEPLSYTSGKPTQAYILYTRERAALMRGTELVLNVALVGKDVAGLTVTLYADYDGDGIFEQQTKADQLSDNLSFPLLVPQNTTSTQGRLRLVVDQNGSDSSEEAYGTVYDLPFYIVDASNLLAMRM